MSTEIERRFIVRDGFPQERVIETERIRQGYLPLASADSEVRVRQRGDRKFMTVKSGSGLVRIEHEEPISPALFDALWPLTESRYVVKERHLVPLPGNRLAEVDVFEGRLTGLVTVEVEFETTEAAHDFVVPAWFGPETTHDPRYQNRSLSQLSNLTELRL
ncbi:CYTH domain-containing protein [Nocardia sp. NPDC088792]|uniref:CYTH domain-containing protein n=1 Tax=Nocardia sp. NPDC088792 TaxID=3364332 RepID=UPI00382B59DD